jgi:hypothetical protein
MFGRNADHVNINGHSVVSINPSSGYVDVGIVDNVMAKLTPLDESTNQGPLTVGFDEKFEFDSRQTSGLEVTDWIDSLTPTAVKIVGPDNIAEILSPVITMNVEKSFNGKTGSKIGIVVTRQGVSKTEAKSFIRSANS